jgi:hypothetical protein
MELSKFKLEKDEINVIDAYNKNKLLVNILNRLVLNLKNKGDDNNLVNFYDEMNSLFLIENKFCIWEKNYPRNDGEDNSNNSNNSRIYSQENFPSVLFLDREDFRNFLEEEKSLRNINSISEENLKLLSLFEEEIRKFLKKKKELSEKIKCKNYTRSQNVNSNMSICLDLGKFESEIKTISYEEIFKKLIENFELITEIYENFITTQSQQEKAEILSFENNINSTKNLLEKLMNSIIEELSGEKSHKVLHEIRKNLREENKKLTDDINELKYQVNRFTGEGEDLMNLVKEYKKICNMIDCVKNN